MFLSVIIPLYNEEKRLRNGFETLFSYLKGKSYAWELVFVDDGSTDGTRNILREIAALHPGEVRIIENVHKGKGAAVKEGALSANGSIVLFTDIDLAVPVAYMDSLVESLERGHDVVIGSRRIDGSVIEIHQPFMREFLGKGYRWISNVILGTNFSDHMCGMKAFTKEAAHVLFNLQISDRWAFDSELLFLSKKLGYRVAEVPVRWRDEASGTKVRRMRDIITSFAELIKIRFHHCGKIKAINRP